MVVTITNFAKDSNVDKSGADAVKDKVNRLLDERGSLRRLWRENTAALKDAVAAGRLFGVEIELPSDIDQQSPPPSLPRVQIQRSLFETGGETTIRQAVLDQLKMAGEKGIKAAPLRKIIEATIGRQLHYKTIGMTLYRLSERGLSRRDGLTWYYVPQGAK